MPQIGEIKWSREIGYKSTCKWIWSACVDCGEERWRTLAWFEAHREHNLRCRLCAHKREGVHPRGKASHLWRGGRIVETDGYILIKLQPSDFFYSMVDNRGYVAGHRLTMARHLGRCLHRWEIVHHKGTKYPKGSVENRGDNRIENLQLVSGDGHKRIHIMENVIARQAKRIKELEMKNRLLLKGNGG